MFLPPPPYCQKKKISAICNISLVNIVNMNNVTFAQAIITTTTKQQLLLLVITPNNREKSQQSFVRFLHNSSMPPMFLKRSSYCQVNLTQQQQEFSVIFRSWTIKTSTRVRTYLSHTYSESRAYLSESWTSKTIMKEQDNYHIDVRI